MTISIAWIRCLGKQEELIFASDSRLRGGYEWDTAQKIFPLPGLNAVLSFAGATDLALPVVHQILSSCANYGPLKEGAEDINNVRGHILNIINDMARRFINDIPQLTLEMQTKTQFLFGGHSHLNKQLKLWTLKYSARLKRFTMKAATKWGPQKHSRKLWAFAGDHYKEYVEKLGRIAWRADSGKCFKFEPLQVLVEMLESGDFAMIGGAPQVVKVYEHRNFLPYAVRWPDLKNAGKSRVHLYGRPLLQYERTLYPILDPRTMEISYPLQDVKN